MHRDGEVFYVLLWSSLGTLKLAFNISSDNQSSHSDDLPVSYPLNVKSCKPNVDDLVGPTLAQRWSNVAKTPLGQRQGSWPKRRWANDWCQRLANEGVSVGPTLGQRIPAVWASTTRLLP